MASASGTGTSETALALRTLAQADDLESRCQREGLGTEAWRAALRCYTEAQKRTQEWTCEEVLGLAKALVEQERYHAALRLMLRILVLQPWHNTHWRVMGLLARGLGRPVDAAHCTLMALRAHPDSEGGRRWALTRSSCRRLVMHQRYCALSSPARVAAWQRAISSVVRPGDRVCDVGEGQGFLCALALKAGAARAVRCEPDLPVAGRGVLQDVESAEVVSHMSGDFAPDESMDVLLVDTLHADCLASGALSMVRDLRARNVLRPGATVVPCRLAVRGAVVESDELRTLGRVTRDVAGFDVRPFNAFGPTARSVQAGHFRWEALTPPAELCAHDLMEHSVDDAASRTLTLVAGKSGSAHCLLFWNDIRLTGDEHLIACPMLHAESTSAAYRQTVLFLDPPIALAAGDELRLEIRHDGSTLEAELRTMHAGGAVSRSKGWATGQEKEAPVAGSPSHYHFPMLADHGRASAYDAAISLALARALEADTGGDDLLVLDIGAGTGLLAMLASRAHARMRSRRRLRVVSCEGTPSVAQTAADIVKLNGFEVTVVAAMSSHVRTEHGDSAPFPFENGEEDDDDDESDVDPVEMVRALPRAANVCISEILGTDPLCEGVLPSLADAHRRLLRRDALVVPEALKIVAVVVECPALESLSGVVGPVAGVDMAPLNAARHRKCGVRMNELAPFTMLTEHFSVFDIALSAAPIAMRGAVTMRIPVVASGSAIAVVAWFEARLFADVWIDTHWQTGYARAHSWGQMAHFFEGPRTVALAKGEVVTLRAAYDASGVSFGPIGRPNDGESPRLAAG